MKIYQIIKEDYDFSVGDSPKTEPTKPSASGAADTTSGEVSPESTSFDLSSLYPELGINLTTLAVGTVAAGVTVAALSKVASNYSRKLKISDRIQSKLMKKYAGWGKVFTVIGIGVAIAELYSELAVVEAMYVQGKLTGTDGGRQMLEQHREYAFGVFQVQLLTPLIIKFISRVIGTTTLVKWFIRALGGVSVAASFGASVVALVASEAFIRWVQWWLGTPAAKEMFIDETFNVIRFTGKPLEALWSKIFDSYKSADIKKFGSEEGANKAAADRKEKAVDTGIGSLSGKTSKTGEVNGIVVTDAQGYLLPASKLQFDQTLQQARRDAVNAKVPKPDPLAKFPLRPGQTLPPIN